MSKHTKQFSTRMMVLAILFLVTMTSALAVETKILTVNLVNQDPDPANAGDIIEIRIGIENQGSESIDDLVLELLPEYPFSMVPGENAKQEVGTISSFQYDDDIKIVKYRIRADHEAPEGTYELDIKYYEEGGFTVEKTLLLELSNKDSAEVIYIDQVELIPGKITPMTFTINNVGSSSLRDLTFQWENEDDIILPVGSDNTKFIKSIAVGKSADVSFNVIASANADPDLYKLDLSLKYTDPSTGTESTVTTKAGVYVGGATDFDVTFSGIASGESTFSISNIGSVAASSVTVRIPDQTGWNVQGSNSAIIGNLNEGDYTIASFTLQQLGTSSEGANSKKNREDLFVILEIVYTDSRGNRNTIEKSVSVDSFAFGTVSADSSVPTGNFKRKAGMAQQTEESFWSKYKWYLVAGVVFILFVCVKKRYNKILLSNTKYTYGNALKDTLLFRKK